MTRNYLLIAIRTFLKQRTQSILNVLGLALGLACAIYVFLYVNDELTYDTQHPDPQNTYRLIYRLKRPNGNDDIQTWAAAGWAEYLKANVQGINDYSSIARLGWPHSFFIPQENGDEKIVLSEDVSYVMPSYAQFFYLDLLEGDRATIFSQPSDMLISASAARELFGDQSALNKRIQVSHPYYPQKLDVVIKGIFRDFPYNMQMGRSTKYLLNREIQKPMYEGDGSTFDNALTSLWGNFGYYGYMYLMADDGTGKNELEAKLTILKTEIEKLANANTDAPLTIDFSLLPITETHFADIPYLLWPEMSGNRKYIYIFLTIGVFILLISCLNYINLSTARSVNRAKEVGMRKALGSARAQLVVQFLQESLLMCGLSIFLALGLAILFLPYFDSFANKDFTILDLFSGKALPFLIGLWITVGVLSGLYPAFYISSFRPATILKGSTGSGMGGDALRKILIVVQFSISTVLLVFTLVVIRQMTQMVNNDLNEQGDQILSIRYGNFAPVDKLNVFRNELSKNPDLAVSSFGNHLPRREGFTSLDFEATLPGRDDKKYQWQMMCVGADFPELYGLQLIAGRLFDGSGPVDSLEVLVNEEAGRQLQIDPAELIGQPIAVKDNFFDRQYTFTVRGVVKDFKFESAYNRISPLILSLQRDRSNDIIYYIKLPAGKIQESIAKVEGIWKKVMPPGVGMSHWFISDEFNRLYFEENALYDLSRVFTLLGIVTTALGLFGMSMFMAERRSKEMAIRKVMGASSSKVSVLMINSFLKLLGFAVLIGLPVSYYVSTRWLDSFSYKIDFTWNIIALALVIIVVTCLFTVSFQSLKTAFANPVKALKQE